MSATITRDGCQVPVLGQPACCLCGGTEYRMLRLWAMPSLVRCNRCGLVTMEAKPPASSVNEFYRCLYGEDWRRRSADQERGELFIRILRQIGRRRMPGRFLDVGCGTGLLLNQALQRGWEAVGVEISPVTCRLATHRFGLDLFQGELPDARFADAAFDVVTFIDVLNHLTDPIAYLREAHRVLKPGGLLVVRVPNFLFQRCGRRAAAVWGRLAWRSEVDGYGIVHLHNFSPRTLKQMLEKAGFCRVELRPSWIVAADLYRAVSRGWRPLVRGALLLLFGGVEVLWCASGGRWVFGPSFEAYAMRERAA